MDAIWLKEEGQTLHRIKRHEVVLLVVQPVHPVLVLRHARQDHGTARRATADRGVCVTHSHALLSKPCQIGHFASSVVVDGCFKPNIVSYAVDFVKEWEREREREA